VHPIYLIVETKCVGFDTRSKTNRTLDTVFSGVRSIGVLEI